LNQFSQLVPEEVPEGEQRSPRPFAIIEILRLHQARAKLADLCRQHGISEATLYNWRSRYGGLQWKRRIAS
jgi:hypothetical protein